MHNHVSFYSKSIQGDAKGGNFLNHVLTRVVKIESDAGVKREPEMCKENREVGEKQ